MALEVQGLPAGALIRVLCHPPVPARHRAPVSARVTPPEGTRSAARRRHSAANGTTARDGQFPDAANAVVKIRSVFGRICRMARRVPLLELGHIDNHAAGGRDYPGVIIALCPANKTCGADRDELKERLRTVAPRRHQALRGKGRDEAGCPGPAHLRQLKATTCLPVSHQGDRATAMVPSGAGLVGIRLRGARGVTAITRAPGGVLRKIAWAPGWGRGACEQPRTSPDGAPGKRQVVSMSPEEPEECCPDMLLVVEWSTSP